MMRYAIPALMLLAALGSLGGCSSDDTIVDPPEYFTSGLPFPDTPDRLMQNFQTVYEHMDIDEFRKLIHPDYMTILQESTYNQFPDVGTTLDVNEERRIHERMFSWRDVTDPLGQLVPGIQEIAFQAYQRQDAWAISPVSDPIPDTECAMFDVIVLFDRGPIYSTLTARGSVKFYVTHRDSVVNGVAKTYYQMLGQVDLTLDQKNLVEGDKAVDGTTWGSLKASFR